MSIVYKFFEVSGREHICVKLISTQNLFVNMFSNKIKNHDLLIYPPPPPLTKRPKMDNDLLIVVKIGIVLMSWLDQACEATVHC
jgi:hypothetical protein